ncbi:hypothetical protein FRB96_005328 [Tulasnella sp. 330]|nr:hypothetical protein FRB96_005328 [Tulasnella sp. 330]KAG8869831.1 hypothetical protein FRB97_000697 [Tulasnella sp. 331]KAG8875162.1 hypothetical protein FRB98_008057 [Tulasnella sp. 332]
MSTPSNSLTESHDPSKAERRDDLERRENMAIPRALTERVEETSRVAPLALRRSSNPDHSSPTPIRTSDCVTLDTSSSEALPNKAEAIGPGFQSQLSSPSVFLPTNPFKKLPLELLAFIFELGTRSDPATFPTLVAQVTKYWREVALSRRALWTYINWSGAKPDVKAMHWLERSRSTKSPKLSAPIHISLRIEEGFDPDPIEMQHVMALLRPEMRRWRSFEIHVDREPLELALELCCDTAAPMLHTLSIRCAESGSEGIEDQFILFNDQTPALRDVRLVGVPVLWTGPLLHNLTALHLAEYEDGFGPSIEELTWILTASPGLTSLGLDNAGISRQAVDDSKPVASMVHLPELQYLHLTSLDWDVYFWFSDNVGMPRVHTYTCNEFDCTEANPPPSVIANPFPLTNLRNIVAFHTNVSTYLMHKIFKTLEKLATVKFAYCSVKDNLLEELVWQPEEGQKSCPNLTELELERCEGFSMEQVKRLVLSRQAGESDDSSFTTLRPAALHTVQVIGSAIPVSADDLKWFGEHGVRWID